MQSLKEVESRLKSLAKIHAPGRWVPEDYIGGGQSKFRFINLKVPHIRQASRSGYSFSDLPLPKQWKIWDEIWQNTPYFEAALSSAHFANSQRVEDLLTHRQKLFKWQERVDNWALSDELSNLFARMLETDPKTMMPVFQKWNRSKNPWNRRQSMVGLLFYSRFRKKALPFRTVISFVEPHMQDTHYYVQKGVGWTLRECWNLYPNRTFEYLKKRAPQIPTAGWTAATEKLSKQDKSLLLKIRKSTPVSNPANPSSADCPL